MSTIPSGINPNPVGLSPTSFGALPGVARVPKSAEDAVAVQFEKVLNDPALMLDPTRRVSSGEGIGGLVKGLISEVDAKSKASEQQRAALLSGESQNIHQAIIASQEASVSFSLLVEMRNKFMETYQELMRLQV